MRTPLGTRVSFLEGLKNLMDVGGGEILPKNRDVILFELPDDVNILLNNREVRTNLAWDEELFPVSRSDLLLPRRVRRRHKEGPRLRDQAFYDSVREIHEELLGRPQNVEDDWVADVMLTERYCSPGCAVIWKDRESIATIDNRFIYRLDTPDTPEARAPILRSIDKVTKIVFEEWRRRKEAAHAG